MRKKRWLMRFCFVAMGLALAAMAGPARADLLLVENFDGRANGNSELDATVANGVLGGFVDTESDGTGNVQVQAGGAGTDATAVGRVETTSSGDERGLTVTGVNNPIEDGETGVLFFRFRHENQGRRAYDAWGITPRFADDTGDDPLGEGDENDVDHVMSAGFLCYRDSTTGGEAITIYAVDSSAEGNVGAELTTVTPGTWYDCWIVADNSTDTFDLYIQESTAPGGPPPDGGPTTDPLLDDEPFNAAPDNETGALYGWMNMHFDDPPRPWGDRSVRTTVDDIYWDGDSGLVSEVAQLPDPKNGATLVSIDTDLAWGDPDKDEPNVVATFTYDVYFGSSVPDANCDGNPLIISGLDVNMAENVADLAGPLAYDTTYYWRVDVVDPNGGGDPIIRKGKCWSFTTCPAVPVILADPAGTTVDIGGTAMFTVDTTCGATMWQWKKDGVELSNGGDIAGADTDTLTISNVEFADEGEYSVVVSNGNGSAPESASGQLLTCRLIGHWKLDGDLTDSVQTTEHLPGSGTPIAGAPTHDGSVIASADAGEIYVTGADDTANGAYDFTGDPNSNVIAIPDPNYFNFYTRAFTVSAWVKDDAADGFDGIVSKQDECCGGGNGWTLEIDSQNEAVLTVRGGGGSGGGGDEAVAIDEWHMITGTFDAVAGQARFYLDGHLTDQDGASAPLPTDGPVVFGGEDGDTTGDLTPEVIYEGFLDDVQIYSCALTPEQVATLYTSFTPADDYVCIDGSQTEGFLPDELSGFDKNADCIVDVLDVAAWSVMFVECNLIPTSACQ